MNDATSSHDDLSLRQAMDAHGDRVPDAVAAEAVDAARRYLADDPAFAGDVERLATTIAGNRCHDLDRWRRRRPRVDAVPFRDWLADAARSIVDEVEPEELAGLLQPALGRLSADCRALLRASFVDGLAAEVVRARLGIRTVQGVYYRRSVCLRQVKAHLSRRLHEQSGPEETDDPPGYTCIDPQLGGELWRRNDPATDAGFAARIETHVTYCASCRQQRAVEAATAEGLRTRKLKLGSTAGRELRRIRLVGGLGGLALAAGLALMLVLPVAPPAGEVEAGIVHPAAGEVVPGSRPTLRWTAIDGASSYHVSVTAVGGDFVWQASVSEPTVRVPEDRPLPSGDRFRVVVQPVPAHLAPPGGLRTTFSTGGPFAFVAYRARAGSLAGQILAGLGLAAVVTGAMLMGKRRSLTSVLRGAV